jgi:hypothetical protein
MDDSGSTLDLAVEALGQVGGLHLGRRLAAALALRSRAAPASCRANAVARNAARHDSPNAERAQARCVQSARSSALMWLQLRRCKADHCAQQIPVRAPKFHHVVGHRRFLGASQRTRPDESEMTDREPRTHYGSRSVLGGQLPPPRCSQHPKRLPNRPLKDVDMATAQRG